MQRFAVVDVETTGFSKLDRVIEVAVVLMDGTEIINEWETLVNPERDISNSNIHGITSNSVSMAPSFKEISGTLANLLDDRIIIAHNVPFDKRMLAQEFAKTQIKADFGDCFCTLGATKQKLHVICEELKIKMDTAHRALSDARAAARLFTYILGEVDIYGEGIFELQPSKFEEYDTQNVPQLLSRAAISKSFKPAQQHMRRVFRSTDFLLIGTQIELQENELSYLDGISMVMSDFIISEDERKQLDEWASILNLTEKKKQNLHERFLNSLIETAKKDNNISELESQLIKKASIALGITPQNVTASAQGDIASYLQPGRKVCFTGKAFDRSGNEIFRETLELYAAKLGLVPVDRVTKKDCDVLVAQDEASMSGKSKKARDFNIPVISVDDFFRVYHTKQLSEPDK